MQYPGSYRIRRITNLTIPHPIPGWLIQPRPGAKNCAGVKHFVIVLFLLSGATLSACAAEMLRLESSADAMGSTYSLVLYGDDRAKLESASANALEEAHRLDNLLSNYKPDSEWSRINREAATHPVPVSKELYNLFAACLNYSSRTEGAFDISVGPLMKVWGFYKDSGHLPQWDELHRATSQIGYQYIKLNAADQTVFFTHSGVNLDPGGIGKGYAVDRIVDILKRDGITSALVSAAGSSIYCLGAPPESNTNSAGWTVRINDPRQPSEHAAEVVLKNQSLSTSGSKEKFFVADGKTYSHIMDPRTGYPAQGALSVSIIAPRTIDSEAWAKPYFINGRRWTASHKPADQRVFYCEDKVNQPCAWLP